MANDLVTTVGDSDRAAAIATLTLAFSSDPVLRWVYASSDGFLRDFPDFVATFGGRAFEHGTAESAGGLSAVALWLPSGVSPDEDAIDVHFESVFGDDGRDDRNAVLAQMDAVHPHQPHWYLPLIGVDPAAQGLGLGSALLRHRAASLDRDRLPAYLEATSERSRDLYARHGYEVLGVIQAGSSPPLWPMLRQPHA